MKKFLKYGLIALVALFVLVAILPDGKKSSNTANTSNENTATETVEEVEEIVAINAKELAAAYESNEVAADKQFKGKKLEVTGKVSSIDSSVGDAAVVRLTGVNAFNSVMAGGDDAFNDYAATLNKGANITLLCVGDGEIMGSPSLKKCQPKQ